MQQDTSKGFLLFTKKEKRGTMFLLAIIALIFVSAKYFYPLIIKESPPPDDILQAATDSLQQRAPADRDTYTKEKNYGRQYDSRRTEALNEATAGKPFYFDPNTLDAAGWQKLGVREKTIATIQNYLSKGGKFRQPEDILKIWGLRDEEKNRLLPFVRIAETAARTASYSNSYPAYEKRVFEKKMPSAIDINAGDSAAFTDLPGIGPGFSRRIVNFRKRLGGFYSVDQVAETFGLPDSVFQKIKPFLKISGDGIQKININTATNEELKAHPYIRWQLANVITEYKKQHGDFKALPDLKKIMVIDDATYARISPYLSL